MKLFRLKKQLNRSHFGNFSVFFMLVVVGIFMGLFLGVAGIKFKVEVDEKTYNIDKMIAFVKRRLDEITKINLYNPIFRIDSILFSY